MAGLLSALNAGKTSLRTSQKAVEIAGNNISNVNTPGYSRQVPVFQPVPSLELNGYFIGQGVTIDNISREHDVFLTRQLIDKQSLLGEEGARSAPMAELERIFSVSENNISTEIDRFFDSWAELSTNPSGQTERQIVLQRGGLLASSFEEAVNNLHSSQQNIDASVESKVTALNPKLKEIADLNLRISTLEASGQTANSDRDRRDLLLEDVSKAIGATWYEEKSMVSVQLPGGMPLVSDTTAMQINAERDTNNHVQLELNTGSGQPVKLGVEQLGGEFKGLIDIRDNFIPDRLAELDHLAYSVAYNVNELHTSGFDLNGDLGKNFFKGTSDPLDPLAPPSTPTIGSDGRVQIGTDEVDYARKMGVVNDLLSDPNKIAAGTAGGSGDHSGDNSNALDIAALGQSLDSVDGNDSFTGYFSKITSKVGIESNRSEITMGGLEDSLVQLRNMRDSTVGVSLEEEMVNLMQYQKGFEASAKFLSTVDELMGSLLELKR